jgi:hypothetical protein
VSVHNISSIYEYEIVICSYAATVEESMSFEQFAVGVDFDQIVSDYHQQPLTVPATATTINCIHIISNSHASMSDSVIISIVIFSHAFFLVPLTMCVL